MLSLVLLYVVGLDQPLSSGRASVVWNRHWGIGVPPGWESQARQAAEGPDRQSQGFGTPNSHHSCQIKFTSSWGLFFFVVVELV